MNSFFILGTVFTGGWALQLTAFYLFDSQVIDRNKWEQPYLFGMANLGTIVLTVLMFWRVI